MKVELVSKVSECTKSDLLIVPTITKGASDKVEFGTYLDIFSQLSKFDSFEGAKGDELTSLTSEGINVSLISLGKKSELTDRDLINKLVKRVKSVKGKFKEISIDLTLVGDSLKGDELIYKLSSEILMTVYSFTKYKTKKDKTKLSRVKILSGKKGVKIKKELEKAEVIADAVKLCRDLTNEPPNVLHSEKFATVVEKDAKSLSRVKIKVLTGSQIKKEKMDLLLAVNAGSNKSPRVVHLTYLPVGVTKKTKHVALVGKGLTFDSGGYSLKPSASMVGMKGDMGGAAIIYAAFKAAVNLKPKVKISCFLGMTDNMISSRATTPDSIIKARNGKTVEILNTDAEGRLVLADVLDYASEQKPNVIIDAATLTGAMLVALGTEVCGLFSNNDLLSEQLDISAKKAEEHLWRMPIIDEFRKDIVSKVADLKNTGSSRFGGASKAAAFLEKFVRDGIAWAHLDVAGVSENQSHVACCPAKGASGLMVRTLVEYLVHGKI